MTWKTHTLGVQKVPDGYGIYADPWDFRRANPDNVYPTWVRWLDRLTQASVVLFERHGAPDSDLAAFRASRPGDDDPSDTWIDAVYAWGDAAAAWTRARQGVRNATLKRAVAAIRRAADGVLDHEDGDQPYAGILRTVEVLPFIVGASLVSSSERPAWLVSKAEVERIRTELKAIL